MTILGQEFGPGRVSVTVSDARGIGHTATPLFAAAGQVNVILPCSVPSGEARLVVTVDGRSTEHSEPFYVVNQNFQLFTRNQRGFGPAIAENLGEEGSQLNSVLSPAGPGRLVALWGTGLGTCEPESARPVTVWVGGRVALALSRQATGIPGIERLVVLLPLSVPTGCFVPVAVRAGREFSNGASMSVGIDSRGCADKMNGFSLVTPALRNGPLPWARIQLLRGAATTERPGIVILQTSSEQGEAGFVRSTPETLGDGVQYPPLGSCLVRPLGSVGRAGTALDAGQLTLQGPWDLAILPDREDGIYRRRLAPTPFDNRTGDFIRPESRYVVAGQGGRQVGPFQAAVTIPRFLDWNNREELPFVLERSGPVVVKWSGGSPTREVAVVRGFSFDRRINRGREFLCTEAVDAGTFRLPEAVIASLPSTGQDFFLSVGNMPILARPDFQAAGIEAGFFSYETATGRNFALQ